MGIRKRSIEIEMKAIMFRLNEPAKRQLDVLAAEQGRSRQEILTEAVNYVFKINNKKQIA